MVYDLVDFGPNIIYHTVIYNQRIVFGEICGVVRLIAAFSALHNSVPEAQNILACRSLDKMNLTEQMVKLESHQFLEIS